MMNKMVLLVLDKYGMEKTTNWIYAPEEKIT